MFRSPSLSSHKIDPLHTDIRNDEPKEEPPKQRPLHHLRSYSSARSGGGRLAFHVQQQLFSHIIAMGGRR